MTPSVLGTRIKAMKKQCEENGLSIASVDVRLNGEGQIETANVYIEPERKSGE